MDTTEGPHSCILQRGVGGGGGRDFLGLKFRSMKNGGIFLGHEKKQGFFGYCTFHQLKSTITLLKSAIYCWCGNFLGMLKCRDVFWVDKFRSWDFFGYKI